MNIWAIIPLITCIVYIVLLILALQQTEKRVNKIFAFFLSVAAFWSFTSFMLHLNAPPQQTMLWNQILVVALVWTLIAYYHFVRAYTNRPAGKGLYVGYALLIILAGLSLSGYIVEYSRVVDEVLDYSLHGASQYIITVISLVFVGGVILLLVRKYRGSTDPADRNRIRYLMIGWSILVALTLTNNIPAVAGFPLDHIGSLINALIISYAISRFQLLDVKLVVRRGLTYVILSIVLVAISTGVILIGFNLFPEQPISSIILFTTLIVILLIAGARPLLRAIQEGIDRLFYRKTYDYRQALLGFSSKMDNILNLDELAKAMLPPMTKALNITNASLLFQDNDDGYFTTRFSHPQTKPESDDGLRFNTDSPIITWLSKGHPLHPERIDYLPELKGLWQEEKTQLTAADLGLLYPLKSRGKLIGILALGKKRSGGPYSHEDIVLITSITNQAGIIIANAQLYTQATIRANTDGLTNLYNHRHFHERLEQEIARGSRFGSSFSLIILDIDLFKSYNDVYGHLAGDQILRKVGNCIESSVRNIDLAFRYGGEEFAVILPETRLDDAYRVAERIRKTIESKASFRTMPVTVSLGIASWPSDGVMKEEIIARADAALYRAKHTGRNRTCLSSEVLKPETPLIGTELEARPKALSIIYALAATVDAKDSYTYGHSRKVSEYAMAMAEALKMPQDRVSTIRAAGLLHDIGKVGIPDSILNKKTPLTDDEWKPIKAHSELGVEILRHVIDLVNCLPAIMHHHEHYDGSGYPSGLKGEDIPVDARILAITDSYDAMTSPRSYRKQLSPQEAVAELRRCAGTHFDPDMVDIFCKILEPDKTKILEAKAQSDNEPTD